MQKDIARAVSPKASPVNVVLGNFKTPKKASLSSYYEQKKKTAPAENTVPSPSPVDVVVQTEKEPFEIRGMRSANPALFISTGLRALHMMTVAVRIHASDYLTPEMEAILPLARYDWEVPPTPMRYPGAGGKNKRIENMTRPYFIPACEGFVAFCNALFGSDTAVYPLSEGSITTFVHIYSKRFERVGVSIRQGITYLVIDAAPLTQEEARKHIQFGFPIEMMPAELR